MYIACRVYAFSCQRPRTRTRTRDEPIWLKPYIPYMICNFIKLIQQLTDQQTLHKPYMQPYMIFKLIN